MSKGYELLIEPVIVSKNKRVLLVFQPKELIENSEFELKFKITNKGGNCFSGGTIKNIETAHIKEGIISSFNEEKIPRIPSQENRIIDISRSLTFASGILRFKCQIEADDKKPISYFQKDKLENDKSEMLSSSVWEDFVTVTSRHEIHQRYTNYLLSIMTLLLLFFTIAQVLMFVYPYFPA